MAELIPGNHLGAFALLPPAPDVCQECAVEHDPADPHDKQSAAEIEDHFKTLAKRLHPDAGGSAEAFQDLVQAREQALQYIGQRRSEP